MYTLKRHRLVYWQTGLMLTTIIGLILVDAMSVELFFVISLLGFLALSEIFSPFYVGPRWRKAVFRLVAPGLVIFAGIVVRHVIKTAG